MRETSRYKIRTTELGVRRAKSADDPRAQCVGVERALGVPPDPNSELSVRLVKSFTACGKTRRAAKSTPRALKRRHIYNNLTARVKRVRKNSLGFWRKVS